MRVERLIKSPSAKRALLFKPKWGNIVSDVSFLKSFTLFSKYLIGPKLLRFLFNLCEVMAAGKLLIFMQQNI